MKPPGGVTSRLLSPYLNPNPAPVLAQVEFHFPPPSELPPPLIQMIDVEFKYPGR